MDESEHRIDALAREPGTLAPMSSLVDPGPELETERLRLRPWCDADLPPFAKLNADPVVNEFLLGPIGRLESDLAAGRIRAHFAERGFGLWAVEVRGEIPFAGFVGLSVPSFDAHFTPCVEVGWRLSRLAWGKGYAPEAARAALRFGFEELGLSEIVSFTVPENRRSRRVMEKIGMRNDPADDFAHPKLDAHHPLSAHVLYRVAPS